MYSKLFQVNLKKTIFIILMSASIHVNLFAQEEITINFEDLDIKSFIKITSKILNKNILISPEIKGKVNFIVNKKVYKEDILGILIYVLKSKGFTMIKEDNIFQIVRLNDVENKDMKVIYLKNAESKNIIKIINGLITQNKNNNVFATIDDDSNSIVLLGPKDKLDSFVLLIKELDVDRQQVYVQAKIVEVSESKTREVGLKYGLGGAKQYSSGLASFIASLSENSIIPSIPAVSQDSDGNYISNDILSMGVSLNLLNQNGAADIVSEPSLLCINNQKSTLYVGQTVSIKTGSTTSTGSVVNDSFKREDIGLTLSVKPRISTGGKVLLEITTKVEDVSKSSGANGQPDTSKKELETSAIVNDGESIILGGYIKNTNSETIDKVPFLGDLPLLGSLFRNKREVKDKINLVIIITPYIVPKSKDLTYVRNKLAQLKLLENKYTKDALLRLEIANIKEKRFDLDREEERFLLEEDKTELKEDILVFQEEKKEYFDEVNDASNDKLSEKELHHKRVQEILGGDT